MTKADWDKFERDIKEMRKQVDDESPEPLM